MLTRTTPKQKVPCMPSTLPTAVSGDHVGSSNTNRTSSFMEHGSKNGQKQARTTKGTNRTDTEETEERKHMDNLPHDHKPAHLAPLATKPPVPPSRVYKAETSTTTRRFLRFAICHMQASSSICIRILHHIHRMHHCACTGADVGVRRAKRRGERASE